MLRDIRDHCAPRLQVFMEEVSAQLGINDAAGENSKSDNRKDGDDRDKQISDDKPVPQAPQKPASPPAYKTDENINGGEHRQVLEETENAAAHPKEFNEQPQHDNGRANNIQP